MACMAMAAAGLRRSPRRDRHIRVLRFACGTGTGTGTAACGPAVGRCAVVPSTGVPFAACSARVRLPLTGPVAAISGGISVALRI
ncbi:hypothetical protein APR12_004920 [Nocardia amikacinitolerans]|nr:hypothetical protein [Nocardia amikacinitolerans]